LLHLFYPELCVACKGHLGSGEKLICLECIQNLPKTGFHNIIGNPAERIFWGRFPFQKCSSYLYFEKAAGVQQIMHSIKYQGYKNVAELLGIWYGVDLAKVPIYQTIDLIIPVPLHDNKLKIRGYNQSEWFAKGLSKGMNIPVNKDCLLRKVNSETQTRKTRYKRWENVSEIFGISHPEQLENKHILLVDDVVTTGATLEACAQTILALNCGSIISIATLAFAN
jgi:ComF family protein